MIELRICPQCNKVFYANSKESSPPCTHCGYVLINRTRERKGSSFDLTCTVNGKKRGVTVKDYSDSGAMIVYIGELIPLKATFICEINELNIKRRAEIVWSKKINKTINAAGLKFSS